VHIISNHKHETRLYTTSFSITTKLLSITIRHFRTSSGMD